MRSQPLLPGFDSVADPAAAFDLPPQPMGQQCVGEVPRLITSGVIAAELGQPRHRVKRILTSRGDIRPAAVAGRTRLYHAATIARVRHELNAIDARRCRREATIDA